MKITTLQEFQEQFTATPEYQKELSDYFNLELTFKPELAAHRHYVRSKAYGFGEDEFTVLWELIIQSMPNLFTFCEIGVHRGAILSLIGLISKLNNKVARIYGVSPMNGSGLGFDQDFMGDLDTICTDFGSSKEVSIIKGYSTDADIMIRAAKCGQFDCLYIDGSHEKPDVISDLQHYTPMIKSGGLLVVDDCNNNRSFSYDGRFWGIQDVADATDEFMNDNPNFDYIGSIIHISLWRKK